MLRVLHVIPSMSDSYGGPAKAMLAIERELLAAGVSVEIATTDDDGPGRHLDSSVVQMPPGSKRFYHSKRSEFYAVAPGLVPWLWANVRSFDVVHIHALFTFTSVAAGLIARLRGVPYVVRPLGTLAQYGMKERRPRLKRASLALIEGPILRNAAAVHFTSEMEREEAQSLGVPMKGVVIPLGVEVLETARDANAHHTDNARLRHHTILYLSRLDPKKNVEGLLRAVAQILPRFPNVSVTIAGSGTAQYEASLRRLAGQLGIGERVAWLGHVAGREKARAFNQADLFVLPSYSENFGIAAVEAMLAGLPCVLGRDVAIAREAKEANAALAVDPEPERICEALCLLLEDENFRRATGERARHFALSNYSSEAMARGLVELYTRVIEDGRMTRAATDDDMKAEEEAGEVTVLPGSKSRHRVCGSATLGKSGSS